MSRKRTNHLTDRLREALARPTDDGRTIADQIVDVWIDLCLAGDADALCELVSRLDVRISLSRPRIGPPVRVLPLNPHLAPDVRDSARPGRRPPGGGLTDPI
jgi:hypothetical protein